MVPSRATATWKMSSSQPSRALPGRLRKVLGSAGYLLSSWFKFENIAKESNLLILIEPICFLHSPVDLFLFTNLALPPISIPTSWRHVTSPCISTMASNKGCGSAPEEASVLSTAPLVLLVVVWKPADVGVWIENCALSKLIPIIIHFFIGGVPETILARDLTTIADDSFNTLLNYPTTISISTIF